MEPAEEMPAVVLNPATLSMNKPRPGIGAASPASSSRVSHSMAASLFLSGAALGVVLGLLLLPLLGLERGEVDVPDEEALDSEPDEDDEEVDEEVGLVVEDGDGLVCGADGLEPVEVGHCGMEFAMLPLRARQGLVPRR